jgi:tetratricopeptide (TPR) repeat protein
MNASAEMPADPTPWEQIARARTLLRWSSLPPASRAASAWGLFASPWPAWNGLAFVGENVEAECLRQADELLRGAVKQDPANEWAHYYQGVCAYRQQRVGAALQAFSICIALAPQRASAYYHRGLAHTQREDYAAALEDYSRALQLDPELAGAALNRGLVYAELTHYAAALKDLDYALIKGANPQQVRANRLLIQERRLSAH